VEKETGIQAWVNQSIRPSGSAGLDWPKRMREVLVGSSKAVITL